MIGGGVMELVLYCVLAVLVSCLLINRIDDEALSVNSRLSVDVGCWQQTSDTADTKLLTFSSLNITEEQIDYLPQCEQR